MFEIDIPTENLAKKNHKMKIRFMYGDTVLKNVEFTAIYGDRYKGIDVSEKNGLVDWGSVATARIDFAMIRIGTNNVGALVGFIVGLVLLCLLSFFTTLCEVAYRESSPTKLRYAYRKAAGRLAFKLVEKKDMVVMCNRLLDVLCTIAIVIVAIYLGLLTIGSNWLVILKSFS